MTDSRKYTPDAVTAVLEHMLSTAKWLDSQGLYVMANGVNSAHDIITAQAQEIEALRAARVVAAEQALDEGLWFEATSITEAYLQQALRRIAKAIEGRP